MQKVITIGFSIVIAIIMMFLLGILVTGEIESLQESLLQIIRGGE